MDTQIATRLYNHFKNINNGVEHINMATILSIVRKKKGDLKNREIISELVAEIQSIITAPIPSVINPLIGSVSGNGSVNNSSYMENFPERQRHMLDDLHQSSNVTYCFMIDSKDRDINTYSGVNCFTIELPRIMNDVSKVELMSCIIINSPSVADAPYLLLVLDELGSTMEGSNNIVSKAFAVLDSYELLDGYRHYRMNSSMNKKFPTMITLNRITVKVKLGDGTICEFEDNGKTAIQIMLKVTCGKLE